MEGGRTRPVVPEGLHRASEWSWRLLLVAAAVLAVGWALSKVFLIVVVVIVALLLATLFEPPAARLRRRGWSAGAATAVAMTTGLLLIVAFTALLVPQVADEFGKVGDQAAGGVREAQRWLIEGPLSLSANQVDRIANGIVRQLQGGGGASLVSGVVSGAVAAGAIIAAILLTIALTAFFVRDGRTIWSWLVGLLPAGGRRRAEQIGEISWETLGAYVRGIAVIGLFDAVFIGLGMLLLGVPLVLPLMALTFLGAFIPLVGSTVAGLVAVLVALVDVGAVQAGILALVIVGVQQFEGNVLYPVVMRRAVDVHPVAVLLAVTAGALVMGIFGAIISVPVVAVAGRVLRLVREEHAEPAGDPGPGEAVLLEPDGERRFVPAQGALAPASSRSTSD
jgi:predicted PurR-regulated permease PerM